MKKFLKNRNLFVVLAMSFVGLLVSCSKVEPVIMPLNGEVIENVTKTVHVGNAEVQIYFTNNYAEDIDVTIKNIALCEINENNEIIKTILSDKEIEITSDLVYITTQKISERVITDNIYVEFIYDAVQKYNKFPLATNSTSKAFFYKDGHNNIVEKWKEDYSYHYAFSPVFNEITFNPSVENWN